MDKVGVRQKLDYQRSGFEVRVLIGRGCVKDLKRKNNEIKIERLQLEYGPRILHK